MAFLSYVGPLTYKKNLDPPLTRLVHHQMLSIVLQHSSAPAENLNQAGHFNSGDFQRFPPSTVMAQLIHSVSFLFLFTYSYALHSLSQKGRFFVFFKLCIINSLFRLMVIVNYIV